MNEGFPSSPVYRVAGILFQASIYIRALVLKSLWNTSTRSMNGDNIAVGSNAMSIRGESQTDRRLEEVLSAAMSWR
jgi:hypothetical protein